MFMYHNILAVTNRKLGKRPFLEQVERVAAHHPLGIVLREKDLDQDAYYRLAREVLPICQAYQVPCVLHTYWETARQLGNMQIHLPLWRYREISPQLMGFQVIGVSVHSVQEAQEAEKLGATYLMAGHIFSTDCKQGVPPRGVGFLEEVSSSVKIPVFAIGGMRICKKQIEQMMGHGAAGVCVMSEAMKL